MKYSHAIIHLSLLSARYQSTETLEMAFGGAPRGRGGFGDRGRGGGRGAPRGGRGGGRGMSKSLQQCTTQMRNHLRIVKRQENCV